MKVRQLRKNMTTDDLIVSVEQLSELAQWLPDYEILLRALHELKHRARVKDWKERFGSARADSTMNRAAKS